MVDAALAGYDIAYVREDRVSQHVAEGRLRLVLGDWSRDIISTIQAGGGRRAAVSNESWNIFQRWLRSACTAPCVARS
ncbi:hypothetical protein CK220_21215 [Mesorhizobium sp. WSM3860]|nr:hypothetical protein CK220_21215 [Mesorhizobium sp. WSM3860]